MNIIVIALIVVVIFLISQNMQKKEDFAWWDDAGDWFKGAGNTVKSGFDQGVNYLGQGVNYVDKGVNQAGDAMIKAMMGNLPGGNQNKINCGDATLFKCAFNGDFKNSCPNECATGTNSIAQCRDWAYRNSDECRANPNYMLPMCAQACNERDTNNKVMF